MMVGLQAFKNRKAGLVYGLAVTGKNGQTLIIVTWFLLLLYQSPIP